SNFKCFIFVLINGYLLVGSKEEIRSLIKFHQQISQLLNYLYFTKIRDRFISRSLNYLEE
ncbi:hypothetical protein, partial [Kaistella sp.]|uniref:hypothetical protein n=1 Tax=Kaistella sp. TaxID=2782235 RepID=UPI003C3AC204